MPSKFKLSTKNCKYCGNRFESPTCKMRVFCSHTCANRFGNEKRSNSMRQELMCTVCGKLFYKRPSDLKIYANSLYRNRGKYCSTACLKAKTQTVSSLKKKAWNIFAKYIKERDGWTCYTCGKVEQSAAMHAGHFISRRYNATLFDEDNVHAQCSACNMFRNGEPHLYAEKLVKEYGQDFLLRLIERSKATKKFTKIELLDICEKYKAVK